MVASHAHGTAAAGRNLVKLALNVIGLVRKEDHWRERYVSVAICAHDHITDLQIAKFLGRGARYGVSKDRAI